MDDSIELTQYGAVNSSPRSSHIQHAEDEEAQLGNGVHSMSNSSPMYSDSMDAGGSEAELRDSTSTMANPSTIAPDSLRTAENEAHLGNKSPTRSLLEARHRMSARNTLATKLDSAGAFLVIADWFFSWVMTFTMIGCWLAALLIAIINLVLFNWLDGKPAGNFDSQVDVTMLCVHTKYCTTSKNDQTYITTGSVMLANAWSTLLSISLGAAFTQYLWRLVRIKALRIDTIEALMNIRSNPFRLFHIGVWKRPFVLALMAILSHLIPIASNFPPGALNVVSRSPNAMVMATIPTYNSSDIGNGTLLAATEASLIPWDQDIVAGNTTDWIELWSASFTTIPLPLANLAAVTSLAGQPLAIPSPCGPNCTYTYEFEGPSFNCTTTVTNRTIGIPVFEVGGKLLSGGGEVVPYLPIYSGSWQYFDGSESDGSPLPEYVQPVLNLTMRNFPPTPVSFSNANGHNATAMVTETNLTCIPYRSLYTVNNSYLNGVQNLTYSVSEIERLPRLDGEAHGVNVSATGNLSSTELYLENLLDEFNITALIGDLIDPTGPFQDPLNSTYNATASVILDADEALAIVATEYVDWTEEVLLWYRNIQMMAMVTGITAVLNGTISSLPGIGFNNISVSTDGKYSAVPYAYWNSAAMQSFGTAGPLLPYGSLSNQFHRWIPGDVVSSYGDAFGGGLSINFTISQDKVNKILGDYVVSLAPAYVGGWNQTMTVTQFPAINVYSFSPKSHLGVPFIVGLVLVFLCNVLGMYSMHMNGVAANDGGFIQILCTTTGSETLRAAAAGNCLGGDGRLPKDLKDMKVRYGDLVGFQTEANGALIRRAGFGTEDEVMPLIKGEQYGFVKGS